MSEPHYEPVEGLNESADTYEIYDVYVTSGRANELFKAFCKSLGDAIEYSWRDTGDV